MMTGPLLSTSTLTVRETVWPLAAFAVSVYSVSARAVGRPVEIRAYADRVELRQDGRIVGDHRRCFGRERTVFEPWH